MTAYEKIDITVSESVFTEWLILNVFFYVFFIPLDKSVNLSLNYALHIVSSSKSTSFDGTMLRLILTNFVTTLNICDTNTLTFSLFYFII